MKVLVLGAGAVGTVSALRFARRPIFRQLVIADAVPGRAQALADRINDPRVRGITLDAAREDLVVQAIRETGTTLVLNAALPVTNLIVMRACLEAGADYIDLASGGTEADGIPKLDDQFALDAAFRARGRLALLGMGADPGTSNIYAAHIAKHLLEEVTAFHVRDGDDSVYQGPGGMVAAFSPWVFIDECLCPATVYRDGRFDYAEPLSGAERFDFPEIGKLTCFHVDHEETTTLPRFFGAVRNADFKFTLGEDAIATLRVLHQLGLSRKKPIQVDGMAIVPRNLVVALLPKPVDLAGKLVGRSCVGTAGPRLSERRAEVVLRLFDRRSRAGVRRAGRAGHGVPDRHPTGGRRGADRRGRVAGRRGAVAGAARSGSVPRPTAGGRDAVAGAADAGGAAGQGPIAGASGLAVVLPG